MDATTMPAIRRDLPRVPIPVDCACVADGVGACEDEIGEERTTDEDVRAADEVVRLVVVVGLCEVVVGVRDEVVEVVMGAEDVVAIEDDVELMIAADGRDRRSRSALVVREVTVELAG